MRASQLREYLASTASYSYKNPSTFTFSVLQHYGGRKLLDDEKNRRAKDVASSFGTRGSSALLLSRLHRDERCVKTRYVPEDVYHSSSYLAQLEKSAIILHTFTYSREEAVARVSVKVK